MVKIPKFSELTDLDKLKKMGSDLASKVGDTSKMADIAKKVTSSVTAKASEYTSKKANVAKADVDNELNQLVGEINHLLNTMYEGQKQQVAQMNQLKKHIQQVTDYVNQLQQKPEEPEESDGQD